MKRNGFTLIELMAVIVLIGIIAVIAVPIVTNVLQSSKESALETQKAFVERAGKTWAIEHSHELNEDALCVSISRLISDGNLEDGDIKDPTTNESLDKEKSGVMISFENNNYKVTFIDDIFSNAGCRVLTES